MVLFTRQRRCSEEFSPIFLFLLPQLKKLSGEILEESHKSKKPTEQGDALAQLAAKDKQDLKAMAKQFGKHGRAQGFGRKPKPPDESAVVQAKPPPEPEPEKVEEPEPAAPQPAELEPEKQVQPKPAPKAEEPKVEMRGEHVAGSAGDWHHWATGQGHYAKEPVMRGENNVNTWGGWGSDLHDWATGQGHYAKGNPEHKDYGKANVIGGGSQENVIGNSQAASPVMRGASSDATSAADQNPSRATAGLAPGAAEPPQPWWR